MSSRQKEIPSSWNRNWLALEALIFGEALAFEGYAVYQEYGKGDKRFPTISRTLVALFKLKPLQFVTVVLGFVLAWHWGTIRLDKARLRRLERTT